MLAVPHAQARTCHSANASGRPEEFTSLDALFRPPQLIDRLALGVGIRFNRLRGRMTYLDRFLPASSLDNADVHRLTERQLVLLVVEDDESTSAALQPICEFLDVAIERIPSEVDLGDVLREFRPMGVIAGLDCRSQDGCHVMITVADYDRTLPILLLVGRESWLAGAVDAVEEVWQLEYVTQSPGLPSVGQIVDFIFKAGRKGRCPRMMRLAAAQHDIGC
jgi:hypothetical protein